MLVEYVKRTLVVSKGLASLTREKESREENIDLDGRESVEGLKNV